MAQDVLMKVGDTLPPIMDILVDDADHPVDLTTAVSVTLHLQPTFGDGLTLIALGEIIAPEEGEDEWAAVYRWPLPQALPSGVYRREWEVLWDDGEIETFPKDGYVYAKIVDSLG
jgi:hypothetical protein